MLDELVPHQFDEWIAYRTIEPDIGDRLVEILKFGFAMLCRAQGAELSPDDFDPLNNEQDGATREQTVSPAQGAAMFAASFGPGQRG